MTLRTLLSTARAEIGYWLRGEWSFEEVGRHWDRTEDYDEVNQGTYSYFRRFTDGLRLATLPGAGTTLDLCARTGLGTKFFFEEGKIARAVCADVSMRMGRICAERMRQSGLADLLPSLETVYVGLSAGSMVVTPRIGADFVEWQSPTGDDRTLGIVDFSIFPHLDHPKLPENSMADAERWAADLGAPAYAIDDETAIKVADGAVDVVTEGHWKLFPR